MNEDNKDLEYIINYFKEKNNKEQQEIYENIKKEYNLLHKLKKYVTNKNEIETIEIQLNVFDNKIKLEQDKIKQNEEKIYKENISLIKEKLQNYECRNNILDNLINRSEELINESEKILNNSIDNTDKLINQIKKNETIIDNNLNNLDSLEKNINDTDLKIENTIKQKIEDSIEKNKNTTPVITTESLYEELKKSKQKEDTNSIKNNIYNQINKKHSNQNNIDDNKKINKDKESKDPSIYNNEYRTSYSPYYNEYSPSLNPYSPYYNEYSPSLNPYIIHNNEYNRPYNLYTMYNNPYTNNYNQRIYSKDIGINRKLNDRLDSLRRKLYDYDRPNTPSYKTRPIDNYNKEYSDNLSYDNKYKAHFEEKNEYINNSQEINREIILIENKDNDSIFKRMFDKLKNNKNEKDIIIYEKEEKIYYDKLEKKQKEKIDKLEQKILKLNNINTPLRFRILKSHIPLHTKAMIINKLNDLTSNKLLGGSEISKYTNWVNSLLKVPFKKYRELPINTNTADKNEIGNYLVNVRKTLDNAVFGHTNTKEQITQIIAQWISNPTSIGNCIGIQGVMGNGKTTLVKNGISKAIDRPFAFITLGGCSDSSYLDGHNYTYEGSTWGKIVDVLIECKCMNPVFYFDELDKVSNTPKGDEIINTLIHLTDSSQNNEYSDKYFNGVCFDLSKSLFIFSFNDKNKINSILLDRLVCIETEKFTTEDKIEITNNYLLNDIYLQLDIKKDQYKLSNELIEYIITTYTEDEGGVRSLKKKLFNIFSKLNLLNLTKHDKNIKYSFDLDNQELENNEITKEIIDKFIKNNSNDDDLYYKNWYV